MQWLSNLVYYELDSIAELLGMIEAPVWLTDLSLAVSEYTFIVNYYFPIDTLATVMLSVINVTIILMLISSRMRIR